jgi:hypothetical protein
VARSQGSGRVRYRLQYRHTVRTHILTSITIGPSLTGLRGTQLTGSIIYTLASYRCVVATREKTTFLYPRTFALFTLCTLLNVIICCLQLNTQGVLGRFPASGFLVIDAVGWRSMYFVVMPRVNLIVIIMTYVRYLYSINCPTVICLPSMLLYILWRDTTSELWTLVQFPLHCYTVLLLLTLFTFLHTIILLPLDTLNPLFIANR